MVQSPIANTDGESSRSNALMRSPPSFPTRPGSSHRSRWTHLGSCTFFRPAKSSGISQKNVRRKSFVRQTFARRKNHIFSYIIYFLPKEEYYQFWRVYRKRFFQFICYSYSSLRASLKASLKASLQASLAARP